MTHCVNFVRADELKFLMSIEQEQRYYETLYPELILNAWFHESYHF